MAAAQHSEESLIHMGNASKNNQLLQNCRIVVALASGCVSGILGFTNLAGIIFCLLSYFFLAFVVAVAVKFKVSDYFTNTFDFVFGGILSGLMTYLLCWTLMYNIVYIY